MVLLFSFVLAMLVTMVLIPPLMKGAERLRFVDIPDSRKVHSGAIPRIGGIAMALGAMVPMVVWLPLGNQLTGVLIGLGIILFFGVCDDRLDLDYRLKFIGQGLAIFTIILWGGVHITTIPFLNVDQLPFWTSTALTMFVLLAVTNAINLSDGLDGLAAGTTLLNLGLIAFLAYSVDLQAVYVVALAVMGSILGFLRFNTHPARIFMGDGGSQFLGLTIGVLALMLTQGERADFSPMLPFLLLGLPLLDTAMVMVQRLSEGRSPFSPDRNHIHHRLLALGLSHYEAVLVIYLFQAGLTVAAYLLRYASDIVVFEVFATVCISIAVVLMLAKQRNWHLPHISARRINQMRRVVGSGLMVNLAINCVIVMLPLFVVISALLAPGITEDIGLLGLMLMFLLLFEWWRGCVSSNTRPLFSWLERGIIYIVMAVLLYLSDFGEGGAGINQYFFGILVVAVVIGFRYSRESGFHPNPSDFLIVFLAIALPTLPQARAMAPFWTDYIPKLVVLYYGVEMVLPRLARNPNAVRLFMSAILAITLLRGVL